MESPEDSLCRQCGLCCDGSLFADVILTQEELTLIEQIIGYEQRDDRFYLQQPCSALDCGDCQVYSNRPKGCREFECQILSECKAGKRSTREALATIQDLKEHIRLIRTLLNDLDQADPSLPLSYQYETALSVAWDLSAPEEIQNKRDQLFKKVSELETALQDQFRS